MHVGRMITVLHVYILYHYCEEIFILNSMQATCTHTIQACTICIVTWPALGRWSPHNLDLICLPCILLCILEITPDANINIYFCHHKQYTCVHYMGIYEYMWGVHGL